MKIAIDVHYKAKGAKTVCAAFEDWKAKEADFFNIKYVEKVEDYIPGQFYKRELPCILAGLETFAPAKPEIIIIDGFVVLDDDGKPGLGAYLYDSLNQTVPVIGVAKTSFHKNKKNVIQVFRGKSTKPLFISSAGIEVAKAAELIKKMHGEYRMPDILREVDRQTKED